ncbi:thioredoxin domain-containing protein [Candidatus Pacearchaeota archaeon]|nr:thioredoxin domain-containing protein [Candidatus Pacearchaeota archaeon]
MVEKKEHDAGHSHEHASKKIKVNFWMVAAIVLAVLLLGTLIYSSVTKVSARQAGKILTDFAASQGVILNVTEIKSNGAFYEVVAEIQGQTGSFYVTKDGKYFSSSIIPLNANASANPGTDSTPQPTNVPKSDKPKVELFVMTHCPYGTQAEKGFLPAVGELAGKIDSSIKFTHFFLHEPEYAETPVQMCIREEQNSKFTAYLTCFLTDGNTTRCLKNASIDQTKLNNCIDTKYDGYYAADSALSEGYAVQGSPTLVINGVQVNTGRSPAAMLATICSAFNVAPEECNTQLDSANPSAGFGWTVSQGNAASAQC